MGSFFQNAFTSQSVGNGMNIAGGVYNAMNAIQQGKQEQAYDNYIAKQYDNQAREIGVNASYDLSNLQEKTAQLQGTQRAALGANGQAGSASSQQIEMDTLTKEKLDEAIIKYNASLRQNEALEQAKLTRVAGKNAKRAATIQAMSTILGTAGQVADSWYRWKQTGAGSQTDLYSPGSNKKYPKNDEADWNGLEYVPVKGGYMGKSRKY